MKLKKAAQFFDNDSVYDGYTGAYLFKAQFSTYDGASPDGSFERRRTVSVAPGTIPAARRVVTIQGDRWIMGELVSDTFKDQQIRLTCSAKKVMDSFVLLSPGNAALRNDVAGLNVYGYSRYLKDTVNSNSDSDYDPFYDVSFGWTETIPDGYFLKATRQYFHIRSTQLLTEGFVNAACDEVALDSSAVKNCEVNVTLAGAMDPITESYAEGITTTGLLLDMYKLYKYDTQSTALNKAGDMSLVLSKTISIAAGQAITVGTEPWRIIGYSGYYDAWNVHIRRA